MSIILNPLIFSESNPSKDPELIEEMFDEELSHMNFEELSSDDNEIDFCFSQFNDIEQKFNFQDEIQWVFEKKYINSVQGSNYENAFFSAADWLFSIYLAFPLSTEILFQSFSLLTKCMSAVPIPIDQLQLVATTCLWIFLKMDHENNNSLDQLYRFCHGKYSKSDFTLSEIQILSSVNYNFHPTTVLSSLNLLFSQYPIDQRNQQYSLSLSLCMCFLSSLSMYSFRPSLVALSALILSGILINSSEFSVIKNYISLYRTEEILECCSLIIKTSNNIFSKSSTISKVIQTKQNTHDYILLSTLQCESMIKKIRSLLFNYIYYKKIN